MHTLPDQESLTARTTAALASFRAPRQGPQPATKLARQREPAAGRRLAAPPERRQLHHDERASFGAARSTRRRPDRTSRSVTSDLAGLTHPSRRYGRVAMVRPPKSRA